MVYNLYISLFFSLLSSSWKLAGVLLLKLIGVNDDPQISFSFTAWVFSLGL